MTEFKYRVILTWSERDNRWLAEVPELPGCMADGSTPTEALAHAQIIIGEWIEVAHIDGRPVPDPKPMDVPAASA